MTRHPGPALLRVYVRPTRTGVQARVTDPRTGRDVKFTASTVEKAMRGARGVANQPLAKNKENRV